MNRAAKFGVVLAGYALAFLAAAAAAWFYDIQAATKPYDTSGGMYARGQLLLSLAVFCVVALVPTLLALWFLRRHEGFWNAVAVGSLGFASLGLLAVHMMLAARGASPRVALVFVQNKGTEAHEFDPYRLEPGRTPADFIGWNESGHRGPAPAIALGGSGTFMPGRRVWLPLTLQPGRYFAFCEMPAKVGGQPHYRMGMVREFEVK